MKKIKLILFVFCFVNTHLLFSQSYSYQWSYPVNISHIPKDDAAYPDMFMTPDDSIHIAYRYDNFFGNTKNLMYSCGLDTTWSTPKQLTDSMIIYSSQIVVDKEGTVFIGYDRLFGEYDKSFIIMKERGIWQPPFQVSDDSIGLGFCTKVVIDNNDIVYVFYSNFTGVYWCQFKNEQWTKVDSIITFPAELDAAGEPKIVVDKNNNIHLIFWHYEHDLHTAILYYMLYNGGEWTEKYTISTVDSLGGPRDYDLAVDNNNNPQVVYTQKDRIMAAKIILFYTKMNSGIWTTPVSITNAEDGSVFNPKIRINPINNIPYIMASVETKRNTPSPVKCICPDGSNWIIDDILKDCPNFITTTPDFLFDKGGGIHYVFGRSDSVINDLYYSNGTIVTSVKEQDNADDNKIFLKSYPNPFNSSIQIIYQLPKEEYVTMSIYDSIGRKIKDIASGHKFKGKQEIYFDANFGGGELASGVYYIHLQAGEMTKTIKILLAK